MTKLLDDSAKVTNSESMLHLNINKNKLTAENAKRQLSSTRSTSWDIWNQTRISVVSERPRDASCHWIFR